MLPERHNNYTALLYTVLNLVSIDNSIWGRRLCNSVRKETTGLNTHRKKRTGSNDMRWHPVTGYFIAIWEYIKWGSSINSPSLPVMTPSLQRFNAKYQVMSISWLSIGRPWKFIEWNKITMCYACANTSSPHIELIFPELVLIKCAHYQQHWRRYKTSQRLIFFFSVLTTYLFSVPYQRTFIARLHGTIPLKPFKLTMHIKKCAQ